MLQHHLPFHQGCYYCLIVNNNFDKGETFFIKKELRSILNLYAKKVSSGDWKDYGLSVNKKEVTFDVYQRSSEKPVYRISKNLDPKRNDDKFYILDRNGRILKKSDNLENLIRKIEWNKLKLVKQIIIFSDQTILKAI